MPSAPQASSSTYHTPVLTPHTEFQGLSVGSPTPYPATQAQPYHEQQGSHSGYPVPPNQVASGSEFHSTSQHGGIHRESLGQSAYPAPSGNPSYTPQQTHPGQNMPLGYRGDQSQQNYAYGSYHNG
ncbi:hypothetical protein M8818_007504 [Zalaria obscura]|uniref:Uncharacterized protein n=1 Tax=Zalaria obscura TaxID=2024903 RepID=A0ACC3S4G0_9PEZI